MLSLLQTRNAKPLVFGHRGSCEEYPENTILSFDMAVKQGALGIETDLYFTHDMQMVCFHDLYLNRLTTGSGRIDQMSLNDLSRVKVTKNAPVPQPIPTIFELLDWCPSENYLIFELKDHRFGDLKNLADLLNLLDKYNVVERSMLSSFSRKVLAKIKQLNPYMLTNFITFHRFTPIPDADFTTPLFPIFWINPSYIQLAHSMKKYVTAWDPHPELRMQYYLANHLDLVTGDSPAKIIASLG